MNNEYKLLPQVAFSIMLALSLRPRHGYEIMKQVETDSNGKVKLGPGALYGSLKTLNERNLVEEIDDPTHSGRRRLYQLTDNGSKRLSGELSYLESTLNIARQRQALQIVSGSVS
jgi:DNA-binding PadR family transcriptional regulator